MRRLLSTSICIQLAFVTFVREDNKSRKKVYCHPLADVTGWLVYLDDLRRLYNAVTDLFGAIWVVFDVVVQKPFKDNLIVGVG